MGGSQEPIVRERYKDTRLILKVNDPIENPQDAIFIAHSRQDVETLIGIVEFLLDK